MEEEQRAIQIMKLTKHNNKMNTTNNTIFISGSSAGIGLEMAKLFSQKGNNVIINGRNKERLDNAVKHLNNVSTIQGDISTESERIKIANELKQNHPKLNVVINNAGEAYNYSLSESERAYENAHKEITTNYLSIIHLTELLLPFLKEKDSAAIINTTSIAALLPISVLPTYSASKAALHSYTQSLRQSLIKTNIKVFEVLPPLVNTSFSEEIGGENGIPPEEVAMELLQGFENDQLNLPVGQTKQIDAMFQEIIIKLNSIKKDE